MSTPTLAPAPAFLLFAKGIGRRFGHTLLWDRIDLTMAPGEVVLLAGANGVGKSSLLRCLAGLARPSRGQVMVGSDDLYQNPAVRQSIGYLSNHSLLYGDLTARENLEFAAALQGLRDQGLVDAALRDAGLLHRASDRVAHFSRGMTQRLALARATLHAPAILLLDEPFTGLDPAASIALRVWIGLQRERGCAVLCVTHEPAELWDVTTRVLMLARRALVVDAPRPGTLDQFRGWYLEHAA